MSTYEALSLMIAFGMLIMENVAEATRAWRESALQILYSDRNNKRKK